MRTCAASGMRRGELLAVRIGDVNFDGASVRVERSLEETRAGLRFKPPKSKHGRRTISLSGTMVAILRAHWRQQLELRMALGLGKPGADALLFSHPDGSPMSPDNLSRDCRRACRSLGLPMVMFHALRHTHASALIAKGLDVVQISRRLGHGSPVITLRTYAHLFNTVDSTAADAIESVLRKPGDRWSGTSWTIRGQSVDNFWFVHMDRVVKLLKYLDGDVAEWLKAAVC